MGTQNGHNVPSLESASLKKRKRKTMKRIKTDKIFKKGNRKKSCHLAVLPFCGNCPQICGRNLLTWDVLWEDFNASVSVELFCGYFAFLLEASWEF